MNYIKSVCLLFPCYNEEQNLEGLIRETVTIFDQLVKEYEILIVDDGRSDDTGIVAENLSRHFEPIRIIHHKTNGGYEAALIIGFFQLHL